MRILGLTLIFLLSHFSSCMESAHRVGVLEHQEISFQEIRSFLVKLDPYHEFDLVRIPSSHLEMTFDTVRNASDLINNRNISAIIGTYSETFVHATCFERVPYIVTSGVPHDVKESPFLLNILPGIHSYALAINDIMTYFNWRRVAIIYDWEEGPPVVSLLVDRHPTDLKAYNIRHNTSETYVRGILKDVRSRFIERIIVICSSTNTKIVLTQALYLSLLSRPYAWLVANVGTDVAALDDYLDSRANLTSLLLMINSSPDDCALETVDVSLSNAVLHDAFKVYMNILEQHVSKNRLQMRKALRNNDFNMRNIRVHGCTGKLSFSKKGVRNETYLQLKSLATSRNGTTHLFQYGTWRSGKNRVRERIQPSQSYTSMMKRDEQDVFSDGRIRVTTKLEEPFVQWKNDSGIGNKTTDIGDQLEGFLISIFEKLAEELGFSFNISLVPDGKYGSYKGKKRGWTGMVRQLLDNKADIALAPFQITPSRSRVVDFTKPFMTKGTSLVVKKPERSVSPFQFLMPLSHVVWITIFVAYLFTALMLFAVSRVNSDKNERCLNNFRESFWYIWGTLLRGNLTESPTGISSRIVSSAWWFFSLIVISVYTANLAAFLTISNAHMPITSAADLPKQNDYNYGTVEGSQIENFFSQTNISHYQAMYAHMKITEGAIVRRVEDGFFKCSQEKYAFLWDSPIIRHAISSDCSLMEIGSPFDLKGYGMAARKHSPYTEKLSLGILKLNDNGVLYKLEGKFFGIPTCPDPRSSAKSQEIKMGVASGMFYVLTGGCVLALVVFVIEWLHHKRSKKQAREDKQELNSKPEENSVHNHVDRNTFLDLGRDKDEELITVLTRTLSIGENSIHSRWQGEHL
ncbi:glutamate receptor ionotropic, kainate 2-like isoform X2 [Ostrea edulis]|uniref:glutamate receptor ionotropic, kainate 2-like isoform X2 n=1 Tax=Ostrea edulis TaxID=37623 RepID=UPI0024AF27FB|nr:glutamate receptor ionotropic, kainate 2-like isoform X2 [Ostrea edulis]